MSNDNKLRIRNKVLNYGNMLGNNQPLFKTRLDMVKEFTKLYFSNGNYIYFNYFYIPKPESRYVKEHNKKYVRDYDYVQLNGIYWDNFKISGHEDKSGLTFEFEVGGPTDNNGKKHYKHFNVAGVDIFLVLSPSINFQETQNIDIMFFVINILTDKLFDYLENKGRSKFEKIRKYLKLKETKQLRK